MLKSMKTPQLINESPSHKVSHVRYFDTTLLPENKCRLYEHRESLRTKRWGWKPNQYRLPSSFVFSSDGRRLILNFDFHILSNGTDLHFQLTDKATAPSQAECETKSLLRELCLSVGEHGWTIAANGLEGGWTTVPYRNIAFLLRC